MFTGIITALVTPFRNDAVDETALRALVEDQIKNGVDGLVPVGTTGESPTLNFEEHVRVIKIVVEAARKRVPVIAGTGSNATHEAIELSQEARKLGADGMLQVTPYYNRPTQDGLYRHFKAIVDAVPLPTILYNVPGRTSCDLLPETVARLAELAPIVEIKEATGSALRASQILARVGDRLVVLSGDDATAFPLFALGARGCISVVSNVAPAEMSAMWDAAAAGDWKKARDLHYKLLPLMNANFVETNPIPAKTVLAMMGLMEENFRLPLVPITASNRAALQKIAESLGLTQSVGAVR